MLRRITSVPVLPGNKREEGADFRAKREQSVRSMSTGTPVAGKTAPPLVYWH